MIHDERGRASGLGEQRVAFADSSEEEQPGAVRQCREMMYFKKTASSTCYFSCSSAPLSARAGRHLVSKLFLPIIWTCAAQMCALISAALFDPCEATLLKTDKVGPFGMISMRQFCPSVSSFTKSATRVWGRLVLLSPLLDSDAYTPLTFNRTRTY